MATEFVTEHDGQEGVVLSWASLLEDNTREQAEMISRSPVVSGHVAGPTRESFPRRAEFAFANIRRVLEGEEAINIVTAT